MKFRIFGTLLILVVLGGLFVLFNQDQGPQNAPTGNVQQVNPEDNALKGMKIN